MKQRTMLAFIAFAVSIPLILTQSHAIISKYLDQCLMLSEDLFSSSDKISLPEGVVKHHLNTMG